MTLMPYSCTVSPILKMCSTETHVTRSISSQLQMFWTAFQVEYLCLVPLTKQFCKHSLFGEISSELYRDWLWDENFKFCLIFTHFSRFSPFSGYIWWNNTLSSLENFSLNSILFFLVLMSHPDNGGFLKIAQKRDSISKKTSFCIMVINTDHQESWFLSVGHPFFALR